MTFQQLQYFLEVHKAGTFSQAAKNMVVTTSSVSITISNLEKSANIQTKLYTVTLSVPEDVTALLSGMFADVTFHTDVSQNVIVVPTEAILTSNDIQYVYVVEENVAHYVEVTTGLTGSGVTEVLSGLEEGQQLVTVGQQYLAEGDAVRIVGGAEPAPVPMEPLAEESQASGTKG